MAAIYHANVATIVAEYDIGAPSRVANVFHFMGQNAPWTQNQLVAIRALFDSTYAPQWRALATTGESYLGCKVIDSSSATGLEADNAGTAPLAGTATGSPVADQVCMLISFHEQLRYKGGHGRAYIPGMALSFTQNDGRTISPAGITQGGLIYNALVTFAASVPTADGGPFVPIIWHKKLGALPNTTQPIITATVQPVLATQRRRIRKVSRHKKKVA